jgi:ADP-ribose pyrophosphatase YjhB (NUDIX family)
MNKLKQRLLVHLMKELNPGFLPEPVFFEMQRLNNSLSVEIALYRETADGIAIYLGKRKDSDPFWPGLYHIPGTMVRGNESIQDSVVRLINGEFGTLSEMPQFTRYYEAETPRGRITHLLFEAIVDEGDDTHFFYYDQLPENLVEHHKLLLSEG